MPASHRYRTTATPSIGPSESHRVPRSSSRASDSTSTLNAASIGAQTTLRFDSSHARKVPAMRSHPAMQVATGTGPTARVALRFGKWKVRTTTGEHRSRAEGWFEDRTGGHSQRGIRTAAPTALVHDGDEVSQDALSADDVDALAASPQDAADLAIGACALLAIPRPVGQSGASRAPDSSIQFEPSTRFEPALLSAWAACGPRLESGGDNVGVVVTGVVGAAVGVYWSARRWAADRAADRLGRRHDPPRVP